METQEEIRAHELRVELDRLVASSRLFEILKEYGEPHATGSYLLDLMAWRDLDISLLAPGVDTARFFELGGRMCEALEATDMFFRDTRSVEVPKRPIGLYWGAHSGLSDYEPWRVDMWIVTPEHWRGSQAYTRSISERLTPELRRTILRIKTAAHAWPGYTKTFSSRTIYRAVLEEGTTSAEQFEAALRAAGRLT